MFALAKASAVVGAFVVGIWAGLLVYVVPRLGRLEAAGGDTVPGASAWSQRSPDRGRTVARIQLPGPYTAGR